MVMSSTSSCPHKQDGHPVFNMEENKEVCPNGTQSTAFSIEVLIHYFFFFLSRLICKNLLKAMNSLGKHAHTHIHITPTQVCKQCQRDHGWLPLEPFQEPLQWRGFELSRGGLVQRTRVPANQSRPPRIVFLLWAGIPGKRWTILAFLHGPSSGVNVTQNTHKQTKSEVPPGTSMP